MSGPNIAVEFPQGVSGTQLMDAVKTVCEKAGNKFYASESFNNRPVYMIGQTSRYPSRQILVAPGSGDTYFHPDQTYDRVYVTSHTWPGDVFTISIRQAAVDEAVRNFADALTKHFASNGN